MKRIIKWVTLGTNRLAEHKVSIYAAQATLFIVISALPFLMLMISMLQYIIPHSQTDLVSSAEQFLPVAVVPFLSSIIGELFTGATIPIVSVTSVTTLWSASKGVMSLILGLDNIYGKEAARGYIKTRLLSLLYTVLLIFMLSATLLLFVASKYLVRVSAESIPVLHAFSEFLARFPALIFLAILTAVFVMLHKLLPGQRLSLVKLLPGALFSSSCWIVFSRIYAFYVDNFANYSYIYGSLTAIVLLILWLYFCTNIFLWGAELNILLQEKGGSDVKAQKN